MSIKVRRVFYRGSKWVPLVWAFLFFPVALAYFVFNGVMIEEDVTRDELEQLLKS